MSFRQFGGINKLGNLQHISTNQIRSNTLDIGGIKPNSGNIPYLTIQPDQNTNGEMGAIGVNVSNPQGTVDIDGGLLGQS